MPPDTPNPASAAARTGSGRHYPKRLAFEVPGSILPAPHAQAQNRLRRQRLVEHLHRLGPSPLGHFLNEVERGASVAERLERYARIDPEFVRALGGDRYAPIVHVIDGGERGKGGAP
jgi:hypothetical protein